MKHIDVIIFSKYSWLFFYSVSCLTKTQVASFQSVKPLRRKIASNNLVSPVFYSFTELQQRKQKENHQLHHNESMRNDETKMLEKTSVFRLSFAKGTRGKGIMFWLERFIRQILDSSWLKDILQSTIFRTMCMCGLKL